MVANTGIVVPTNSIACGNNIKVSKIAEGVGVTPGLAVMKGTAQNQVVLCTVGSLSCEGIADLNRNARAKYDLPLTTAYTAGEPLEVIVFGFVKVVADTRGITAGSMVVVGEATSGRISDNAYTAPPGGNTYNTVAMAASLLVRDQIVGRAFTSGASGCDAVVFWGHL